MGVVQSAGRSLTRRMMLKASVARELNFDGLVGPTHHYGGLSFGNLASAEHEGEASNPRQAALQGLEKMRALHAIGVHRGVLWADGHFLVPVEQPEVQVQVRLPR